jgi:DNA polymerase III subunit gamma/tau
MAQSLANKYRPNNFMDVVGQEDIVTILQNQINTKQVKHGYLLIGGPGTGKTTVGRILAHEINRSEKIDDGVVRELTEAEQEAFIKQVRFDVKMLKDMDEAWKKSERAFLKDVKHPDAKILGLNLTAPDFESRLAIVTSVTGSVEYVGEVIEIDAASNNGVDNVRELRETSKYKPINGGYKVYVIDECHMLSTGAWNALLKTFEDPPSHCVFILCTTEAQKIPATILSRLQRFQFKRMSNEQIINRLNYIIGWENEEQDPAGGADFYDIEQSAIEYIAKIANGGMRDAISLLDTCVGYNPVLSLADVVRIIGASDYDTYIDLCYQLDDKDREKIIMILDDVHRDGKDLKQFVKGFLEFIIDIEKYNVIGSLDYTNVPIIYQDHLDKFIHYNLFERCFERLTKLQEWIKYDPNPKILIEGCFLVL